MKKIETRALVEASLLVALAAIILISSAYVPFFALIGFIVWPIPITLLTFRYNLKISIMSLTALLLIVSGFVDPLTALSLGLLYGTSAIVLGFCLRKKFSPFTTIMAMSISMFIAYIAYIKLAGLLTGVDVLNQFFKVFEESMQKSKDIMKGFGLNQQQIDQSLSQGLNIEIMKLMLPGIIAIASLMGSFINYYFVGVIFRKLRISINELQPLDQWYISNNLSIGLFSITIAAWLMTYLKVENSNIVFNSIFVIFSFVFVINGLAVFAWFLKTRGVSRKIRIPLLIFVYVGGFSQILFYLGLIDYVLDFRKINPYRRRRIPPGE